MKISTNLLFTVALIFPLLGNPREPVSSTGEPERLNQIFLACRRLNDAGMRDRAEQMLLSAASRKGGFSPLAQALVHNRLGTFYHEEGKLLKAQHHYQITLAEMEQYRRDYEPLLMRIAINLASSYLESGQVSKAETLAFKYAQTETARTNIPDTGRLISLLGSVATSRGDDREAEQYFRRANAIFALQADGAEGESKAMVLANLAKLCARTERYAEATSHAKAAITTLETSQHPSPTTTIAVLREAAKVFAAQGQFDEAESLFRRALAVSESAFGEGHGLRAGLLADWARVLRSQKRNREAAVLEKRAGAIFDESRRENLLGYTIERAAFRQ